MSETSERPWDNSENVHESLYQWIVGELAKLRAEIGLNPPPAPVVETPPPPPVVEPVVVPVVEEAPAAPESPLETVTETASPQS